MDHPYAEFLTDVDRPARYVGGEVNQVVKDWDGVEVTLALAYPDLYDVGMSHLGIKILYTLLNRDPRIACERCFAPWPDMEAALRARDLRLVSLESARPLSDFDVLGFSLQYELTYTNILLMLDLGGVPLRATERGEEDPLVIAGGPTATHPEPVAPFFDAFVVGDAEARLPELLLRWQELRGRGVARREGLAELARLGGIYVPSLYEVEPEPSTGILVVSPPEEAGGPPFPVRRAFIDDIDSFPFPQDAPVPHTEAIFDRMAVEIARGCTEGCRFCQAGMIYRPVRERAPGSVIETVEGSVARGGFDEVSLTSLSTADYSAVAALVEKVAGYLTPRKIALSVSSLRAYGLPEPVLDDISEVRASGLTFAPEAGTQRMRDVINKNITERDIAQTAHRVFARGWDRVKLYFMVGLPSETDEDVAGIGETSERVRGIGLEYLPKGRLKLTVSISSHVPKPHTPFQWAAFDGAEELERKLALVASATRRGRLDLRTHDVETSCLEAAITRGDRRLADVIEEAYRLGARFDGWEEHLNRDKWVEAFAKVGVSEEIYFGTLPVDARLAWDRIDVGLADGFLLKEYRKALENRLSPPCGKPFRAMVHHTNLRDALADKKRLICYDCGVTCDLQDMRAKRIGFLRGLGADEPRVPRQLPPAGERNGARRAPPRPGFTQGDRHDVRLRFTKLETAVLEGHLDFMRSLLRCVRRAGLEQFYSRGFRPKPVTVFGPALGLGIASLTEYADFALARRYECEVILERLNGVAPRGVRFTAAEPLQEGARRLAKLTSLADYLVALDPAALAKALDSRRQQGESDDALLARRARSGLTVVCERRGLRRERPLRDGLASAWTAGHDAAAAALGFPAGCAVVGLRLETGAGVRPREGLSALLGDELEVISMGRVALWGRVEGRLVEPLTPQPRTPVGRV